MSSVSIKVKGQKNTLDKVHTSINMQSGRLSLVVFLLHENDHPEVAKVGSGSVSKEKIGSSDTPNLQTLSIAIWLLFVWTLTENFKGTTIAL